MLSPLRRRGNMLIAIRKLMPYFAFSLCVAAPAFAEGPFAYITNWYIGKVKVIDTSTDILVKEIDTGGSPFSAAVNPAGTRVYVAHWSHPMISVIDTSTNTSIASIDISHTDDVTGYYVVGAMGVAVHPNGNLVYVTNVYSYPYSSGTVTVIDANTNTVIDRIGVGIFPHGVAVDPAGRRVYVANWGHSTRTGTLSVIDVSAKIVVNTIEGMGDAMGVVVSPSGDRVYVTNWSFGVIIIDAVNETIIEEIPANSTPSGIAINSEGTKIYLADNLFVTVIDTRTGIIIASIPDLDPNNRGFWGIAVDPSGKKVYATRRYDIHVSVVDAERNEIVYEGEWGASFNSFGIFIWRPNQIVDTTPPVIAANADVTELWPADGKMLPVTIVGLATDNGSGINPSGSYKVIDEYGNIQPTGTFEIATDGTWSISILLESSRLGTDKNGRLYTIVITVQDAAGNSNATNVEVVVPHDKRKR